MDSGKGFPNILINGMVYPFYKDRYSICDFVLLYKAMRNITKRSDFGTYVAIRRPELSWCGLQGLRHYALAKDVRFHHDHPLRFDTEQRTGIESSFLRTSDKIQG